MLFDLVLIFKWWSVLFILGLVFLPITRKIFHNFFDQGYSFSKIIGILFSSYLVWLLASLKIFSFSRETILFAISIGLILNFLTFAKYSSETKKTIPLTVFIFEEIFFLLALIFWSFIRGFQPDIQGLEKFMDFGFVNSILRTKYFPPADMWFAGKPINYYYFGHYVAAFLTKLTNINSAITYNLMLATLFAFTFVLVFSLTGNLIFFFLKERGEKFKNANLSKTNNWKLIVIGGLISSFLLSLGANLHPAYYNFKMSILKLPYCDGATFYWYPNATRYIGYCPDVEDKTIHEFPSYSFVVSDLHGHVSDIPFVLLFIGLAFCLLVYLKENKTFIYRGKPWQLFLVLPISATLAIMYMTNQWDFPIYLGILGLAILLGYSRRFSYTFKTLSRAVFLGGVILLLAIFLVLPFQLNFDPIVKGIAFVRAHSLPHQLLILWGAPWFFGASFIFYFWKDKIRLDKKSFICWLSKKMNVKINVLGAKDSSVKTNILFLSDYFAFILLFMGTVLIIVPEIIYLKDIYIPSYHRANTMFKLTYQSFIMFYILIGFIFIRILSSLKKTFIQKLALFSFTFIIIALSIYPFYSIKGYYGSISPQNYKGLYGLGFLKRLYPDDYEAILWLNNTIIGQPNILEAVGDSYTDYNRVSMATGLPTIEGWLVHEWLWRGSFDEPGKRSGEVQTIYETNDPNTAKDILKKYNIRYVFLGALERQKYPNLNEKKFELLGKKVFESGETSIYQLD